MKPTAVALWTVLGVALSSAGAFAVPLSQSSSTSGWDCPTADPSGGSLFGSGSKAGGEGSQFSAGNTLVLDGRLGHKALPPSGGETFVFASVGGGKEEGRTVAAPLNLGIVIDRSGSMKGQRIANALAAAMGTVDRMRDGDMVSVVSFDNSAQVVMPPTRISQDTRPAVISAIQSIRLGGDTCISCGLETAMQEVMRISDSRAITRMLLLSDGAANHGVRDVAGLRSIASRMRDRGCTISTIGVDVDFDEKIMSAIANESNGRHYFVANASELQNVFNQEFESLLATVARDAELEIELAPGVEPVQVFDRTHRRNGQRITIPFGTLSARQEKTVLLKVRVPASAANANQPIARMKLAFQDTSRGAREELDGVLSVKTASGASLDDIDPFVSARLARSLTSDALSEANVLFEQGRVDEARKRLSAQAGVLGRIGTKAKADAPLAAPPKSPSARPLADDFDQQLDAVRSAESSFGAAAAQPGGAASAPARREGKAQVRQNQASASDLAF